MKSSARIKADSQPKKQQDAYQRRLVKFLTEDYQRWVEAMPGGTTWVNRGQHFSAISHAMDLTVALTYQLVIFKIDLSEVLNDYWLVEGPEGKMYLQSGLHGVTLFLILLEGDTLQRLIDRMEEVMDENSIPLKEEEERLTIRDHRYFHVNALTRLLRSHRIVVGNMVDMGFHAANLYNLVVR